MYLAEFWRSTLKNEKEKQSYEAVLSAYQKGEKEITIPLSNHERFAEIYNYVIFDHPELFYYGSSYSWAPLPLGRGLGVRLEYSFPFAMASQLKAAAKIKLHNTFKKYVDAPGNFEKALAVHEFFVKNVKYNLESKDPFNALGPLMRGEGVCQGISLAAKWILDYLGVYSIVVPGIGDDGKTKEPHAWNIVYFKGVPYHIDYTYMLEGVFHNYFGLDDAQIATDHIFDLPKELACKRLYENYYVKKGLAFDSLQKAIDGINDIFLKGGNAAEVWIRDGEKTNRADYIFARLAVPGGYEYVGLPSTQHYRFKRV